MLGTVEQLTMFFEHLRSVVLGTGSGTILAPFQQINKFKPLRTIFSHWEAVIGAEPGFDPPGVC